MSFFLDGTFMILFLWHAFIFLAFLIDMFYDFYFYEILHTLLDDYDDYSFYLKLYYAYDPYLFWLIVIGMPSKNKKNDQGVWKLLRF